MKRIAILTALILAAVSAFGQATRVDIPLQTAGPSVPISGGPLPQALWVANAAAYLCTHPSATLVACQAAPITTYTDSTEGTTCPTATPLVQLPGNTCTASTGTTANVGFWYGGGVFDYWIVSSYGTYGPFSGNSSNSALPSSCGNPTGIPCGGTGATTVAGAWANIFTGAGIASNCALLQNVSGTLTCAATTAAGALANLGGAALSGAVFTGPISAPNLALVDSSTGDWKHVFSHSDFSVSTGTLKINLPAAKRWSYSLQTYRILIYQYGVGAVGEVLVSGYNSSGGSWIEGAVSIRGNVPITSVRLADDGTYNCILLGTISTVWSNLTFSVDVLAAHNAFGTGWGTGWSSAFLSSEAGITVTQTPTISTPIYGNLTNGNGPVIPQTALGFQGPAAGYVQLAPSATGTPGYLYDNGSGTRSWNPFTTVQASVASSNVIMTSAGLYYDGPTTGSQAAGTWLIQGTVSLQTSATPTVAINFTCQLWDGTTIFSSTGAYIELTTVGATKDISLSLSAVATEAGAATFKISCASDTASQLILYHTAYGSAVNASSISAVRIK